VRSTSATITSGSADALAISFPVLSRIRVGKSYPLVTRWTWFSIDRARARVSFPPQMGRRMTSAPAQASSRADYHKLGVDMVWVVDPFTRTLKKYPRGGRPEIAHDGSEIDGGRILPGFKVPIARFFEEE
jgi:hypothetical protein